jgi:hypothetical protein
LRKFTNIYLTIGVTFKYCFVLSAGAELSQKTGVAVVCGAEGRTATFSAHVLIEVV